MKTQHVLSGAFMASGALAARPFLNEADTAIELSLPGLQIGELPDLDKIISLPDFEYAARNYMSPEHYTYYRNGAGGEWSYRNNLEIYQQYRFRTRGLVDVSNIQSTLPTTILGHNVSAPFYMSAAARAGYGHPDAEINLVKAGASGQIMYMSSYYATKSMKEIAAEKEEGQIVFQHVDLDYTDDKATQKLFDESEKAGASAIIFTIDAPAVGNRHRANRFGVGSSDTTFSAYTWEYYKKLTTMTDLPIVLKGIGCVEDAQLAVENKVPAIILSNHGARQVDGAQSSLETALEIHRENPEIFQQIEVWADGGVRYGSDVLKLLSLGVRSVGLGRSFMYANVFGQEGVEKAIALLKNEIAIDAANIGVADLKKIGPKSVNWNSRPGFS